MDLVHPLVILMDLLLLPEASTKLMAVLHLEQLSAAVEVSGITAMPGPRHASGPARDPVPPKHSTVKKTHTQPLRGLLPYDRRLLSIKTSTIGEMIDGMIVEMPKETIATVTATSMKTVTAFGLPGVTMIPTSRRGVLASGQTASLDQAVLVLEMTPIIQLVTKSLTVEFLHPLLRLCRLTHLTQEQLSQMPVIIFQSLQGLPGQSLPIATVAITTTENALATGILIEIGTDLKAMIGTGTAIGTAIGTVRTVATTAVRIAAIGRATFLALFLLQLQLSGPLMVRNI